MLRLVYRSYGGENLKDRPAYYDKGVALQSFLRAVEAAVAAGTPVDVLFLNDGPVPAGILALQRPAGRLVELGGVGLRASYVAGLHAPDTFGWADDDVVWFSEDDYLYRPDAFTALAAAASALPEVDYFALYGAVPEAVAGTPATGGAPRGPWVPAGFRSGRVGTAAGVGWDRILSTTSSFGGRVGALRADLGIFRLCMVPHRTMFRDHDTCVALQGLRPYRYRDLGRSLVRRDGRPARRWLRDAALAPFLVATNLRAHRRPSRRRVVAGAVPNLATHLENGMIASGTDWERVAAEVGTWASGRGPVIVQGLPGGAPRARRRAVGLVAG